MIFKLFQNEYRKIISLYPIWIITLTFLIISYLLCYYFIVSNPVLKQSVINNYFDTAFVALFMNFNLTFILWGFVFMYSTIKEMSCINFFKTYPISTTHLLVSRFFTLYSLFFISLFIILSVSYFLTHYSFSSRILLTKNEYLYFRNGFWAMSSHFFILSFPFLLTAYILPIIIKSTALNVTIIFLCHLSSNYIYFPSNPFRIAVTVFSLHHSILTGNQLFTLIDILPKYIISITYVVVIYYFTKSFLTKKQS